MIMKYTIREYEPNYSDTIDFFDCDSFTEESGDYSNTLFIVQSERYGRYETYGYYLADSDRTDDVTIKIKLCDMACISPDETTLQLIDGCQTITQYSYREC